MKKIANLIFLINLLPSLLWANTESPKNEAKLETKPPRSWVFALAPWNQFNGFVSKDFFVPEKGVGFSTTSRINYGNIEESFLDSAQDKFKTLTFEQTGNIDTITEGFHFQFQIGPNYSFRLMENSDGSHSLKGSLGFVVITNFIFSERAVLSLQMRTISIRDQVLPGTSGGVYVGYRF